MTRVAVVALLVAASVLLTDSTTVAGSCDCADQPLWQCNFQYCWHGFVCVLQTPFVASSTPWFVTWRVTGRLLSLGSCLALASSVIAIERAVHVDWSGGDGTGVCVCVCVCVCVYVCVCA